MKVQKQKIVIWFSIIFCITSCQVFAASPDAWGEHYNEVKKKCIHASNLLNVKPVGEVVDFSDEIGYSLLLVKGVYKFDKKITGTEACLLNRSNRSVSIIEADRLIIPQ